MVRILFTSQWAKRRLNSLPISAKSFYVHLMVQEAVYFQHIGTLDFAILPDSLFQKAPWLVHIPFPIFLIRNYFTKTDPFRNVFPDFLP